MKGTNFERILAFWNYCAPWVGAESHFSLAGEQKFLPTQLGQGWAECISLGDSTQQLTQHSSSFLALAALSSRLFRPAEAEKQRPKNTTNLFSFCQKNCEKYFWSSVEKFFLVKSAQWKNSSWKNQWILFSLKREDFLVKTMRDTRDESEGPRVPLKTILQNFLNHVENLEARVREGDDAYEKEFLVRPIYCLLLEGDIWDT